MKLEFRSIMTVTLTGIWVNASEFLRNEFLLKSHWALHYQSLGMPFPAEPVNGILWGIWGVTFAAAIYWVSRRFNLLQTTLICWVFGFVLMWIVLWNLRVLPTGILIYAVPLSLLEVLVGTYVCHRLHPASKP